MKSKELLGGGESESGVMEFNPAEEIKRSGMGVTVPVRVQDCLKQLFASKATDLENSFKKYLTNPSTLLIADDYLLKIRILHYYSMKYLSEGTGEEYSYIEKLYNKFIQDKNEKGEEYVSPRLYKQVLNFALEEIENPDKSDAGMQSYIHRKFDEGDNIAVLGLHCAALSFYKKFVSCSSEPEPIGLVLNILPTKYGVRNFIENNKDKIACRNVAEHRKEIVFGDRPKPTANDDAKIKYLLKIIFDMSWPSLQIMTPYHKSFNDEIVSKLKQCLLSMASDIKADNLEEDL
jgi:hypothetical protein